MRHIGGAFAFEKGGFLLRVSYDCDEFEDPDTGIYLAIITKITVKDGSGEIINKWVDMEEIEKLCIETAIEGIHFNSTCDFEEDDDDDDPS